MLLIIEGPDCAGKTTLAMAVVGAYGTETNLAKMLHYGPPADPERNPFLDLEVDFMTLLPDNPEILVVVDRLAAGELIYGPLLRGKSRLSAGGLLHCEMLYDALGAVRVMMMPPLHVILSRMHLRGDDLIDTEDCAYIYEEYQRIAPRYGWQQLRDVPGDEGIATLLIQLQGRATESAIIQAAVPGYIGTLAPKVVIAGDVRAGDHATDPYFHAFTPAARGAARFLFDALAPYSRSIIKHTGILNTGEAGMLLGVADKVLGEPAWIALGSNASSRLAKAGIAHEKLPHPAWVTRFAIQDEAEYGKTLIEYVSAAIMERS